MDSATWQITFKDKKSAIDTAKMMIALATTAFEKKENEVNIEEIMADAKFLKYEG